MESGHRHSYHPSVAVASTTDAHKRRSTPDFNFNAMHKKAISPSPHAELDPSHRRMESLTGETTHHVDKVREWLCSTPDVETMERYDFEHIVPSASEDELFTKEPDVNQNQTKDMPGSAHNRMQFIDNQNEPKTAKIDRSRMHNSASALLESSSNKVTRPNPQKPHSKDSIRDFSKHQGQLHKEREKEKEKENLPPPPSQPSVLRPKGQLSPPEDYPPYLSSQLSQSTQALFERMSKAAQKTPPNTQQSLYVYRYSDSTNLTPQSQGGLQRTSQLSSTPSASKDIHTPLQIVTTESGPMPDNTNSRDYNGSAATSNQTLSSPVSSYATVIEHSVTSETNTMSNNRNSYVNEKDWAKALENLGLAFRGQDPKAKPSNPAQRSIESSRHNTPSPAKHAHVPVLETDFPANQTKSISGPGEWHRPKLRSLKAPPAEHLGEQSSSNRSTPSSAKSAPNHSYVNHQQLKDTNETVDDTGYANVGSPNQRHSFADAQKVSTRDFTKVPAKPPRRSPGDKGGIREKVGGGKDAIYMEINDARRLLYEGHPPDPALQLSSSSMQSFGTVMEAEKSKTRNKSASHATEDKPRNTSNQPKVNMSSSLVVRSCSIEDNLSDRHRPQSKSNPSINQITKELRSPVISNSSSQVSISQATGKSSSSEARTSSPGKVRSSTQSPIDNLWHHVTNRPTSRPTAPHRDTTEVHAGSGSQTAPISPLMSQGEPSLSRKQQRLADVQSEESGYTSMGNSLGSKEGLGSPRFEKGFEKVRATYPVDTKDVKKTGPPPVKPKPRIVERPKQLDSGGSQTASSREPSQDRTIVDQPQTLDSRERQFRAESSMVSHKYPMKAQDLDPERNIRSPIQNIPEPQASETVNLSAGSSVSLLNNTHSTSSLNGLLQTDFPDVEPSAAVSSHNTGRLTPPRQFPTSLSLAPSATEPARKPSPSAMSSSLISSAQDSRVTQPSLSSMSDSRVVQASLSPSPSQSSQFRTTSNLVLGQPERSRISQTPSPATRHTPREPSRTSLTPSLAPRHTPTQLSRAQSPCQRRVPTQLSLAPSSSQNSPDLVSPTSGARKPAIAKKPLVLSPQHNGPKPVPRTKSPTKVHFSSDVQSPTKSAQQSQLQTSEYSSRSHGSPKPHEYSSQQTHEYSSKQPHEYLSTEKPHEYSPTKPHEYLATKPREYSPTKQSHEYGLGQKSHEYSTSSLAPSTAANVSHEYSSSTEQQHRLSLSETLDSGRFTGSAATRDVLGDSTSAASGTPFSDIIQRASPLDASITQTSDYNKRWNETEMKAQQNEKVPTSSGCNSRWNEHDVRREEKVPQPAIVSKPDDVVMPKNTYVNLDYSHAFSKSAEKAKSPDADESKHPPYVNLVYNPHEKPKSPEKDEAKHPPYVNLVYNPHETPPSLPPKTVHQTSPPLPAKSRSVSESVFSSRSVVTSPPPQQHGQRSYSAGDRDRTLASPTVMGTSHVSN